MRLWFFLLLPCLVLPAAAQRVGFGSKVGVPLRAHYPAGLGDNSLRLTGGQFVDVRLAGPLSVEFNPMWPNVGFDLSREFPDNQFRSTTRIVDLPVLARLTAFRGSAIRPFVSGGYLRRYASNTISGAFMCARTRSGWSNGWAVGSGVSFGAGFMRIEPEYRCSNAWTLAGGRSGAHDLLVGFRFGGRARRP